jgi:hypothetical protein
MEQRSDPDTVRSILDGIRESPLDELCSDVSTRLVKGQATAGSVWDAVHLASAELRMRAPSRATIVGIHTVTSANGLRHCYLETANPQTRYLILLQAVGWMAQFRTLLATGADAPRSLAITQLEPAAESNPLSSVPANLDSAAAQVLKLAGDQRARESFQTEAVRLIVTKADEVHYFKYLASLIEDIPLVSPAWQPHLLAATVFYMKGPEAPESAPVRQAREALKTLRA